MTDFLGTPIKQGMYCAYPGQGNTNVEYGLILYKIIDVDESANKVKAGRLYVSYGQGTNRDIFSTAQSKNAIFYRDIDYTIAIRYNVSTISSTYKFVVVEPSENIKAVFTEIMNMNDSVFDLVSGKDIANWIHGTGVI